MAVFNFVKFIRDVTLRKRSLLLRHVISAKDLPRSVLVLQKEVDILGHFKNMLEKKIGLSVHDAYSVTVWDKEMA